MATHEARRRLRRHQLGAELGGSELSQGHERAFLEEEAGFEVPSSSEVVSVTTKLVAPTIRDLGSDHLRVRFMRSFLSAEELCCQLFSEPNAGSDLAGLQTRAVRDGDKWRLSGQKVWTSGAQFARWGELIARSDGAADKHAGLTAFIVRWTRPA